jgi:hypothetical protein
VAREDVVLGDDDGVLFVPSRQAEEIFMLAETIRDTERRQAKLILSAVSLRSQVLLATTSPSARKRPPSAFASTCAQWAGRLRNNVLLRTAVDLLGADDGGSRSLHFVLWHQWSPSQHRGGRFRSCCQDAHGDKIWGTT